MEKYSSGWRGAPAKGIGRSRGARVQIPLSPFYLPIKNRSVELTLLFLSKHVGGVKVDKIVFIKKQKII